MPKIRKMQDRKLELIAKIAKNYGGTRFDSADFIRSLDGWTYTNVADTPLGRYEVGKGGIGYILWYIDDVMVNVLLFDDNGMPERFSKNFPTDMLVTPTVGPDLPEIRNKLQAIVNLIDFVEDDEPISKDLINSAKNAVNVLARREVYP